ncbi:hypothetical protein FRB90_007002 [Tulasnella sp. 427]|nr:hypothetical protein FRB90_007002 [Tulasnella sp. 427]
MHSALKIPEILAPIVSLLSRYELMIVCQVCWLFKEHALPLLWADLSSAGVQALYAAFPAGAIAPAKEPKAQTPSLKQLTRPLTVTEAAHVARLASYVRHARIDASEDLVMEKSSPFLHVQSLVTGKLFPNLARVELDGMHTKSLASTLSNDHIELDAIVRGVERTLQLFLSPATRHLALWDLPPRTHLIDFVHHILQVLLRTGVALETFQIPLDDQDAIFVPRKTSHDDFTAIFQASLPAVTRFSLLAVDWGNWRNSSALIQTASQLPCLAELDFQSSGKGPIAPGNVPRSENSFPKLKTLRIRGFTDDLLPILRSIPPTRLQVLEVELWDNNTEGLCTGLEPHHLIQTLTIRKTVMDWRATASHLKMPQLTRLSLLSRRAGPPLTDDVIDMLASALPDLEKLELWDSLVQQDWPVTEHSLLVLASKCPSLADLTLSLTFSGTWFTATQDYPPPGHPSIQSLDLRFSKRSLKAGVSKEDIVGLIVGLYPNLRTGRSAYQILWTDENNRSGNSSDGMSDCEDSANEGEEDFEEDEYAEVIEDPEETDETQARNWWEVWKGVEAQLGCNFTISYSMYIDDRLDDSTSKPRDRMWRF